MKLLTLGVIIIMLCGLSATSFSKTLNTYDMTRINKYLDGSREGVVKAWDELHFVVTIQGIVNRKEPNLYLLYTQNGDIDRFWLEKMTKKGAFLHNWDVKEIPDMDTFLNKYLSKIKGLVVYDGNVPATSNIASTIAGVEDLAAVRYDTNKDSLYYFLTTNTSGPKIPVKKWLLNQDGTSMFTGKGQIPGTNRDSTGSAKNDAYIWAKINYLDTGKCSKEFMGYYIDFFFTKVCATNSLSLSTLVNQDFQIANKGFIFDLNVWEDETAIDDPNQKKGLDLETFCEIMRSAYDQTKGKSMIQVSGFTPWAYKYTDYGSAGGNHGGVDTEWRHAHILSCFNAYMDADAIGYSDLANATVFSKAPLQKKYTQRKPTLDDLRSEGLIDKEGRVKKANYVCFYVGDYDSAAWLYQAMPTIWEDPNRGQVPLGWAINPQLAQRFAFGLDYFRKTATQMDTFVAGDNGAGYLNPGDLVEPRKFSGLPDGVDVWKAHNQKWFNIFDISSVGFVIDGFAPRMTERVLDMYAEIAPDGIGGQLLPSNQGVYKEIMPYIVMGGIDSPGDGTRIGESMTKATPTFTMLRNILWSPTMQKEFMDKARQASDYTIQFLEPYTFFLLMKYYYNNGKPIADRDSDNLFSIKNKITILDHTATIDGFDVRDMFEGNFGTAPEKESVIFKDGMPDGYMNYITFKSEKPAEMSQIILKLKADANTKVRQVYKFRLYAKLNESDNWKEVWNLDLSKGIYPGVNKLKLEEPLNAQFFKIEIDPYPKSNEETTYGPRILEIEAYK